MKLWTTSLKQTTHTRQKKHEPMSLPTFTSAWFIAHEAEQRAKKATQRLDPPPAKVDLLFNLSASKDEAKLNKTERAYLEHLRSLSLLWIGIQNITVKIADDCRLTPDFCYVGADKKLTIVDVKGFQREDALIKMKVAARLFPMFRFVIVTKQAGGWLVKDVDP